MELTKLIERLTEIAKLHDLEPEGEQAEPEQYQHGQIAKVLTTFRHYLTVYNLKLNQRNTKMTPTKLTELLALETSQAVTLTEGQLTALLVECRAAGVGEDEIDPPSHIAFNFDECQINVHLDTRNVVAIV